MTALEALRNANPRLDDGFTQSVGTAGEAVRVRIAGADRAAVNDGDRTVHARLRRLVPAAAVGFSLAAAAAVAVLLTVGSPGGSGVESAAAAVKKAVRLTTAAAEQSGRAALQIRHDGNLWGEKTVRWNGDDVAIIDDAAGREGKVGAGLIVVDGTLYMPDPEGGWDELGSPKSIDPGSGTTPEEYLRAVREDVGGATLRRLTDGMTGMTTRQLADG